MRQGKVLVGGYCDTANRAWEREEGRLDGGRMMVGTMKQPKLSKHFLCIDTLLTHVQCELTTLPCANQFGI
jgi:hypothetical protein